MWRSGWNPLCTSFPAVESSFVDLFQKSRSEDCRGRPVTDRKRKFLDTDLAHDSEGSGDFPVPRPPQTAQITSAQPPMLLLSTRNNLILNPFFLFFNCRVVSGS